MMVELNRASNRNRYFYSIGMILVSCVVVFVYLFLCILLPLFLLEFNVKELN